MFSERFLLNYHLQNSSATFLTVPVTLAGCFRQSLFISNRYHSALVADQPGLLKSRSGHRRVYSRDAEHIRDELLC